VSHELLRSLEGPQSTPSRRLPHGGRGASGWYSQISLIFLSQLDYRKAAEVISGGRDRRQCIQPRARRTEYKSCEQSKTAIAPKQVLNVATHVFVELKCQWCDFSLLIYSTHEHPEPMPGPLTPMQNSLLCCGRSLLHRINIERAIRAALLRQRGGAPALVAYRTIACSVPLTYPQRATPIIA